MSPPFASLNVSPFQWCYSEELSTGSFTVVDHSVNDGTPKNSYSLKCLTVNDATRQKPMTIDQHYG